MGVLRRIETRIAHVFEGIFNRSSRDGIPAVEIARRLVEELEEHKVFRNGGTIVPSTYTLYLLSLIHISEPTRRTPISYAVFCLKKKKKIHPYIFQPQP